MLTKLTRLRLSPLARCLTYPPTALKIGPLGATNAAYTCRHYKAPLNKKLDEKELVNVEDEEEYEVEVREPPKIEPVPQKLINRIQVEHHGVSALKFNDETVWLPVYRVPYLKTLRHVIRAKVYLTFCSIGGGLYYTGQVLVGNWTGDIWQGLILTGISIAGMAYIGDYFRRLVVQVYASEDFEYVRLCRFSFFGNRKDMVLPRDCLIRLPEINRSLRQKTFDIKFRLPEGDKIDHDYDNFEFYQLGFKLPIGLGGVLDKDKFQRLLGYVLSYRIGG